jgi:predicted transcriptional regulator
MAATPKSFRLPEETTAKMKELASLLNISEHKVVQKGIDTLYENREKLVREDAEARIRRSKE